MSPAETMVAVAPAPSIDRRSKRAALVAWAQPAIAASLQRQYARGVVLDTIAFYVLDLRDDLALALACCMWLRFEGPCPMTLAAAPRPPVLIGAVPIHILAEVVADAGPAYAEAAEALRCDVLPEHIQVLVAAAGGVDRGAIGYSVER